MFELGQSETSSYCEKKKQLLSNFEGWNLKFKQFESWDRLKLIQKRVYVLVIPNKLKFENLPGFPIINSTKFSKKK